MEAALKEGRIADSLSDLLPPQARYGLLKAALARYLDLESAGGWPKLPEGSSLRIGDEGAGVIALKKRLSMTGDFNPGKGAGSSLFDDETLNAIRQFQERHGLDTDGIVGPNTLAELNRTPGERARQISVNLERWRWLPQDLGNPHVEVNIAGFYLDFVEDTLPVLFMKVIVGRHYRRTPVFSDLISYLVLNPSWEVPHHLAVADVLPEVRKDPEYLNRLGFKILQGWGSDERVIPASSIDWSAASSRDFRYRLRQAPGKLNSLGQVKIMFPNKWSVYLHDTPKRELFQKTERSFSSGCIRLEKPVELVTLLLREDPQWSRDAVLSVIATGKERTLQLKKKVPVHLLYWTAWVDNDGHVHFRRDLYGRDRKVEDALSEPAPVGGSDNRSE